jgi:hypothetical protein
MSKTTEPMRVCDFCGRADSHVEFLVSAYHGDKGERFRVNIIQRRNPIGFTAKLPGDRR